MAVTVKVCDDGHEYPADTDELFCQIPVVWMYHCDKCDPDFYGLYAEQEAEPEVCPKCGGSNIKVWFVARKCRQRLHIKYS